MNQQQLPPLALTAQAILSESVEGIFCLGLGSIVFDNAPVSLISDQQRIDDPAIKRQIIEDQNGNLLWLFLLLTSTAANLIGQWANLDPYLKRYQFNRWIGP